MRSKPSVLLAILVACALVGATRPAHADGVGVGVVIGEPTAFTIKVDLKRRTALEIALGVESFDDDRGRGPYLHLEFLAALFVAKGESVLVPFRLGIGGAIYDDNGADFGDDVEVAARAPFQVAFQFRSSPVELYLEIALKLIVVDDNDNDEFLDLDGGIGFRIYF
jgi:hypothetical protein